MVRNIFTLKVQTIGAKDVVEEVILIIDDVSSVKLGKDHDTVFMKNGNTYQLAQRWSTHSARFQSRGIFIEITEGAL